MRLKELLDFDNIVIQCHDNPDADAIASGYGVLLYLQKYAKIRHFLLTQRPIGAIIMGVFRDSGEPLGSNDICPPPRMQLQ